MIPIRDSVPSLHPAVTTRLIIVAVSLVFVFEVALPRSTLEPLFYLFGIVPARFTHPDWAARIGLPVHEYWPFVTSLFLHAGWLHVIGNLWTLWIFGDNVEDRMGPVRFALFYLVCGVAAGLVHWFTNADSTVPTVGASGAIAGVLGAYFVLFPTSRVIVLVPVFLWPFFFELPAVTFLLFWFFVQLLSGALAMAGPEQVGGIAWWAHVGGFLTGMLLHPLFRSRTRDPYPDELGLVAAWGGRTRRRR
jgi:membrane associated rhomboid family serine protease